MNNILIHPLPQKILTLLDELRSSPPFATARVPEFPKITLGFLAISCLVFTITLSAFYVFQINAVISESYQIRNRQDELTKLTQENKVLEINALQNNSLESIKNRVEELGFERIDQVHYIQVMQSSVAAGR